MNVQNKAYFIINKRKSNNNATIYYCVTSINIGKVCLVN
jgi:hypothetical protein